MDRIGSYYQRLIKKVMPNGINPAGVEASMRSRYGTLDHLPREEFRREARLAKAVEAMQPGLLEKLAASYGMAADWNAWNQEEGSDND